MPIEVKGAIRWTRTDALEPGTVYAMPLGGGIDFVMSASDENHRLFLTLGSVGTEWEGDGVNWIHTNALPDGDAYPLNGAWIEVMPTEGVIPVPTEGAPSGSVWLDANGTIWISAKGAPRKFFKLETGAEGRLVDPARAYKAWRLMWKPETAKDPVVLLTHPPIKKEG